MGGDGAEPKPCLSASRAASGARQCFLLILSDPDLIIPFTSSILSPSGSGSSQCHCFPRRQEHLLTHPAQTAGSLSQPDPTPAPPWSLSKSNDKKDLLLWWPSCTKALSGQSSSYKKSQNHSISQVGRDPQWSWSPTPGTTQGYPNPLSESDLPELQQLGAVSPSLVSCSMSSPSGPEPLDWDSFPCWDPEIKLFLGLVLYLTDLSTIQIQQVFLLIESLSPLPIITCLRKKGKKGQGSEDFSPVQD